MGTFGFWTAYLRPKPGKVIMADGYAPEYHILTNHIKSTLPEWTLLADPCFSKLSSLHNSSSIPELTPECIDKKIEYGIDEISKASKIEYGIDEISKASNPFSQHLTYVLLYIPSLSF